MACLESIATAKLSSDSTDTAHSHPQYPRLYAFPLHHLLDHSYFASRPYNYLVGAIVYCYLGQCHPASALVLAFLDLLQCLS